MGHKPTYTCVIEDETPEWRQGNPQGPFIFPENQLQIKEGLTSQATASKSWVEVFGVWKLQTLQVLWKTQKKEAASQGSSTNFQTSFLPWFSKY